MTDVKREARLRAVEEEQAQLQRHIEQTDRLIEAACLTIARAERRDAPRVAANES